MIPGQFHSLAEVDSWLNQERLPCPYCSGCFEHLGRHLIAKHDMAADTFREIHGLPHNRGLVGSRLHDHIVQRQRLEMERNPEHRRKFVDAVTRKGYSIHPASAAQIGTLRTKTQPMGNRARWGN